MKRTVTGAIKVYKKLISPYLPPACRFYPTCSDYAAEAVERFGVVKGGYLAAKRLLKCRPVFNTASEGVPAE